MAFIALAADGQQINAGFISAGSYNHSLGIVDDDTVVGWGSNFNGKSTPPDDLRGVVSVSAGYDHSIALKSDGTVVGWGHDYESRATGGKRLTDVNAIAAGYYHNLALQSDGRVCAFTRRIVPL